MKRSRYLLLLANCLDTSSAILSMTKRRDVLAGADFICIKLPSFTDALMCCEIASKRCPYLTGERLSVLSTKVLIRIFQMSIHQEKENK